MSAKIMPINFKDDDCSSYAIDIHSPFHFRPEFMSPKPMSPKRKHFVKNDSVPMPMPMPIFSELGKRDFSEAFGDVYGDEAHYGQKIGDKFFESNIGHVVVAPHVETKNVMQTAVDSVIQDFRSDFSNVLRRERDCEGKYDVEEIIEWCDFYLKNRNLYNV